MSISPDTTGKREAIADAVLTLAARRGLDMVSLRHVATEAGISMGQVQYYFGTTAELLYYSIYRMMRRMERIANARLAEFTVGNDPLDPLFAFVHVMINDNAEMRQILRVMGQYESRLDKDPKVDDLITRENASIHRPAADAFRHAVEHGALVPHIDPEVEAQIFWALLSPLAIEVAFGDVSVEHARDLMTYHLNRLRA